MSRLISLAALVAVASLVSCDAGTGLGRVPVEEYRYVATTDAGAELVRGTMTLMFEPRAHRRISGSWRLSRMAHAAVPPGPQVGEGLLVGSVRPNGRISLNLQPENAAHNVILDGSESGGVITGRWQFIDGDRLVAAGPFRATRR
jgi:hypothetical protein